MNQPPQARKRIVSKAAYAKALIVKTGLNGVGFVLMLSASAFVVVLVWAVIAFLLSAFYYLCGLFVPVKPSDIDVQFVIVPLFVSCVAAPMVAKMAHASLNRAKRIELVVPLTRANTADLPAPDILVRASSELEQAQQTMLLRAAESQETPPAQLMRAVGKQEPR